MDEGHYVVEIKVTRVDFEKVLPAGSYNASDREKMARRERKTDEIAHIVVKNKDLAKLKELTSEHLKLVSE